MGEIKKFDEEECVKFIRDTLSEDNNAGLSDDDILYVIDTIWDWYERNGYLEINADVTDDEELPFDDLVAYVSKELHRAGIRLTDSAGVGDIVKAEIQYEESIEDF